jgi:type III secretion protein N (ATPase)
MKEPLAKIQDNLENLKLYEFNGRVIEVTDSLVKAQASQVKVGDVCLLRNAGSNDTIPAEVVGFRGSTVFLAPVGNMNGVSTTTEVITTGSPLSVNVGEDLLGCVLDGLGNIISPKDTNKLSLPEKYAVTAAPPEALSRKLIEERLTTGIRAIDGMLTIGQGQRIGLFAGAGVGKSTLLSMLVQKTDVDIIVVALIGERGKEVREFIESTLTKETRKKTVVIVATSDRPSIERVKAAHTATAVAEYFRAQGKRVFLLMDSLHALQDH